MKAIFGILGLVIVVAIVAAVATKQLHAVGGAAPALPGTTAADAKGSTLPQQAREIQERARANTARALEQGAERNQRADP